MLRLGDIDHLTVRRAEHDVAAVRRRSLRIPIELVDKRGACGSDRPYPYEYRKPYSRKLGPPPDDCRQTDADHRERKHERQDVS